MAGPRTISPGQRRFAELARFHPGARICLNVMEPVEDDGRAPAAEASVLDPGGVIVLLAPTYSCWPHSRVEELHYVN